ncbi:MAG: hypothetical protein KIT45_04210 [Fimbriimonadia bacterium]|nr:hypothetical protein [Fimbriimonadia bacterium]
MPIPYRDTPRPSDEGCAAFIDLIWIDAESTFYGGLLLIDSKGRPIEFSYNSLKAPQDALWQMTNLREVAAVMMAQSLFEACKREPDLLICNVSLGKVEFCREAIAALIPFAQVNAVEDETQVGARIEWYWINDPPLEKMRAYALFQTLQQKDMLLEPFNRIHLGLREVYPEALWHALIEDDTDNNPQDSPNR